LYDENSEDEEPHNLQAEASQASSLSFQPHNLFKEHFAAGSTGTPAAPAAVLDTSLTQLAHASSLTMLSEDAAAHDSRAGPQKQAGTLDQAQAETSYTSRVRKPWGLSAESAGRAEQPQCSAPSPRQGTSQSPGGKPPLPRTAGKGPLLRFPGTGQSPRLPPGIPKSPAAPPRWPSGIPRSPAGSPGTSGVTQAAGGHSREGSVEPQETPHKPTVSLCWLYVVLVLRTLKQSAESKTLTKPFMQAALTYSYTRR